MTPDEQEALAAAITRFLEHDERRYGYVWKVERPHRFPWRSAWYDFRGQLLEPQWHHTWQEAMDRVNAEVTP